MNTLYCKHCGGFLEQSLSNVMMVNPPKYGYICKDCGKVEYLTLEEKLLALYPNGIDFNVEDIINGR